MGGSGGEEGSRRKGLARLPRPRKPAIGIGYHSSVRPSLLFILSLMWFVMVAIARHDAGLAKMHDSNGFATIPPPSTTSLRAAPAPQPANSFEITGPPRPRSSCRVGSIAPQRTPQKRLVRQIKQRGRDARKNCWPRSPG